MVKKVGVISLGCDKNRVDTEKMLAVLKEKHTLVNEIEQAQVVIINTCAFIESAREEAVDEILEVIQLKNIGKIEKIIVTGCLPQRFINEIFDEFCEVDGFLGVSNYKSINEVIDKIYSGERVNAVTPCTNECLTKRVLTTTDYAYLKIADGCSNHCTYCTIPLIRGAFRSIPISELVEEAKQLGNVNELILVAQDTLRYGEDLQPKTNILELIWALSALPNVGGIRLLYCYPERLTDEIIHEYQVNPKMIRYIDIPFQHADDKVLKLMGRKGTGNEYLDLIDKLKWKVNGIAIRSTFMTGFPGEDEDAFNTLVDFLKRAKLFNAGFFKYSLEEGTPSYKLDNQVAEGVKTKRLKKLYSVQKKIVESNAKLLKGSTFKVLAEGFDQDKIMYYGRAYFNAPDVDGKVYFFSKDEVEYGNFVSVKIRGVIDYDLFGDRV